MLLVNHYRVTTSATIITTIAGLCLQRFGTSFGSKIVLTSHLNPFISQPLLRLLPHHTMLLLDQAAALTNEYEILHLIYHRSKNQHRLLAWWKYFNILHRRIRQILKLQIDIERLQTVVLKKSNTKSGKSKYEDVISFKEEQMKQIGQFLVSSIFKKAYYEFSGIITLGQFINLGFTLVGLLAKLYSIVITIDGVKLVNTGIVFNDTVISVADTKTKMVTGEEIGEEVGEIVSEDFAEKASVQDDVNKASKKRKLDEPESSRNSAETIDDIFGKPKTKKKSKKKKKKNEMDDIFGF